MDLKDFFQVIKGLDNRHSTDMPQLCQQIKMILNNYEAQKSYQDLGAALCRMSKLIMEIKEVKDDVVSYFQDLIDHVIVTSIKNQFKVGFDAFQIIFNCGCEFYKHSNTQTTLKYPLGLARPLPVYAPAVGQECDVVRPYITSTSFCGWIRCTVLEIDEPKYVVNYANTSNPTTIMSPWFAPLGSRTQDYDWRLQLDVGSPVDALMNRVWYKSTIVESGEENGSKRVRVSYRRFDQNGDREDSMGYKYFGLGPNEDEWLDRLSPRIQRSDKMSVKPLCYYTHTSEQILPDDNNYDILFEKEYNEKPFHALMRPLVCKSSSIVRFINTFTENQGFQTLFRVIDSNQYSLNIIFHMLANVTRMVFFIPRMDKFRYLPLLHNKAYELMMFHVSDLTIPLIDWGYYCIDIVGKNLKSLFEVYREQNQLRKYFIDKFLDKGLQKQLLSTRYINDLINPKKPYTVEEREAVDRFFVEKNIFARIFQQNVHEQIVSRTPFMLNYFIEKNIVTEKEIDYIWNIVPLSDHRAHAVIEKLFVDISKYTPIKFVERILDKILLLKETQLTVDNLNLLRELKNREISDQYQIKILTYLWEIISIKSINIKTSIEEEVQKVFKVFVSGIKSPIIRANVLESMAVRLSGTKNIKNQIDLLKDFIMSYSQKSPTVEEMDVPLTIFDAVTFLKSKNIYETLLCVIEKTKNQSLIRETLNFFTFLFGYDFDDLSKIILTIFEKIGPSDKFLEWIYNIYKRASTFIDQLLTKTTDFKPFETITMVGYEALSNIILEINEEEKNIKIMKTYEYKNPQPESKSQSTSTPGPVEAPQVEEKKEEKLIGPVMPQTKKHIFILVSPFRLKGMKFLNHLLLVVKDSKVYNEIIKIIIQFIVRLDERIIDKTETYRKQFLSENLKEIEKIIQKGEINDKSKQQIQIYIQLFIEIFSETEKSGLAGMSPHFQNLEGEKLTFNIQNEFPKAKGTQFHKFVFVADQNCTIWKFKCLICEIIQENPLSIDVIKFVNPIDDAYHGKSISEMFFYNNQNLKIKQKPTKVIPKHNLHNSEGTDLSERFLEIVQKWFYQFMNEKEVLQLQGMKKLSDTYWRGSLFRQEEKLKKVYEEHDKQKKGYLTFNEFKEFFYLKSSKNEAAIWKIINLSGYKNNLRLANEAEIKNELDIATLPRRILSSPEVYELIFNIFKNPQLQDVHLNFYRLLCQLQGSSEIEQKVEHSIYSLIENSDCVYQFCYSLQVTLSLLSKKGSFFYQFWEKDGIKIILEKITKILDKGESIYSMNLQLRNTVLPNLIKIINMYCKQLINGTEKERFIAKYRINHHDLDDIIKFLKEFKEDRSATEVKHKLKEIKPQFSFRNVEEISFQLFRNLIQNYATESSDFIPKLTSQIVRLIAYLALSPQCQFKPQSLLLGVKSESLNYRRGCCNIIYFYINDHPNCSNQVISKLLEEIPKQNKHSVTNYFSLLANIVRTEIEQNKDNHQKDQFFIELVNKLLDKLFSEIPDEARNSLISDKIIVGILMTVEIILNKAQVCYALRTRKHEIVEKCLFAYNIRQRIQKLEIGEEILMSGKQQMHFENYVKCKTDDARGFAYNIVCKLHETSKDQDVDFLQKYILPVFESLTDEIRLTSSRTLNVGLKNFGSTCYMNSMLQVLNSVEPFRNLLMQAKTDSTLVNELKNLFSALFYSERLDYAPNKLLESFIPPINPGIQQDTTEFLNLLFDQLESGLCQSDYSRLMDEIFKGSNTAQMICHSCGYKKQNEEPFFSFGVEIEGKYDLGSALEGSYQGEVISDYLCDNCQKKGDTTKRNILNKIPSILFIHLRRIVFNYDIFANMKIHTRLQFPEELNIEPYTKEGVELRESLGLEYIKGLSHNEEEMKKFEELALHGKDKDFYKLKLKGVIVHSGSANAGHYYSILPDGKTWHKFDDSRVSIFPHSGFQNMCYGGTWTNEQWGYGSSVNAYVLVYEKVLKNLIVLQKKGEMEEEIELAYNEVKPHHSEAQYKSVWLDNHRFMVELHILGEQFCSKFMKFACNIMQNSTKSNKIALLSQILYTVTYHAQIIGELDKVFKANISEITSDILYRFIIENKKKTFKLLFSHNKYVREFMATYMQVVLFENYFKGDENVKKDVVGVINCYLEELTADAAKNWLRIDGYLKFFELMIVNSISSTELWDLFKSFNLISVLIDFVMEKSSPVKISKKSYSIGTKTNPMDFTSGLNIIAFLLRHSYGFTGINYQVPSVPEIYLFHLNDNDVTCLSFMDFYRKMLRERQNISALEIIVQRLCIMNLDFSRAISEPILTEIGSVTDKNDEMADISNLVQEVIKIRDDYWMNRAEMILGWTTPYIIGDNSVTAIATERYVSSSNLFDIFPVECLLNYAFIYRINLASFQLLRAIVKGCSVSDEGMRFLASQPSFIYAFSSYIDWAKPYIHNFLNFHPLDDKKKERIQEEIQELNLYIDDIIKYREKHPQQFFYRPIITGKIVEKKQIECIQKGDVKVVVRDIYVYCLNSQPTTDGNVSLDKYLDGSLANKKLSQNSSVLKIIAKPAKAISLKMKPVQEDEDKELVSLFDDYPDPSTTNKEVGTVMVEQMMEDNKQNNHPIVIKQQEAEEQMENQVEEIIDVEGIDVKLYFREFVIFNNSTKQKIVNLAFNNKTNLNTLLPTQITYRVAQKGNQTFYISKLDYDREWGPISIDLTEENYDKEKHNKKNMESHNWYKQYGDRVQKQEEKEEKGEKEEKEKKDESVNVAFEINCPVCTFLNLSSNKDCEVCGSELR